MIWFQCICPNDEINQFEFQNVFVLIAKCICQNCRKTGQQQNFFCLPFSFAETKRQKYLCGLLFRHMISNFITFLNSHLDNNFPCVTSVCLFSTVCFQMSPQIACLRRSIVTLVAFVRLFSTVCYQMSPQAAFHRGCILTLVEFI